MHEIIKEAVDIAWLLLPAAAANMAPVFAQHWSLLPALNIPVDFGLTWRGNRLLGDNKTVRGFVVGGVTGLLVGALRGAAWQGAAVGLGALAGDAFFSFFKRQLNMAPGTSWKPFDQIDFVVGALAALYFFAPINLFQIIFSLLLFGVGSFLVSAAGVALAIKKTY